MGVPGDAAAQEQAELVVAEVAEAVAQTTTTTTYNERGSITMLGLRTLASALTFAAAAALGLATTPAHAVLDQCIAHVTITSTPTSSTTAKVVATVTGSCPTSPRRDEMTCIISLVGAPDVAKHGSSISNTDVGCSASVTIANGRQGTPYVAVGTTESVQVLLPGVDVAAVVP